VYNQADIVTQLRTSDENLEPESAYLGVMPNRFKIELIPANNTVAKVGLYFAIVPVQN
jgi:hypothetical protein